MNSANSNSYFFLLSSFFLDDFFKTLPMFLTLSLACWQMAQMTQITQMCAGDRKCARMCAGVHGSP